MHAYIQHLLDFAAQHSWLAAGLALVVSATEAMFVIGMFVPSTLVLVGLGGLIGAGNLPFWPLFLATTLGAVVGDAFSYWLGHHYKERLYTIWPISHYQDLLTKGKEYFAAHGGKSVVIGRFIPGVKSVVPVIAGMMQMSQMRFAILNILSSLVWAATHLLPGMSAGWVLGHLAGISKRLAITLALIVALGVLLIWLIKRGFSWGSYYLPRWKQRLQHWVEHDPARKQGLLGQLVLVEYADFRKRALLYVLLALSLSGFSVIMINVLLHTGLGGLDQALSESLQGLRTYWSDMPMLVATLAGDAWVIMGVLLAVLTVLLWQGQRNLVVGIVLAFLIASLFIFGLKGLLQVDRPVDGLYQGLEAYSFPSAQAGWGTLLAGLLAWFVIKGWRGKKRFLTVSLLALLTSLIALSRIYLGAQWPSDILGS
ncbi:MAG TPA: VTT domain-containing protein, partial [Thiolinea sp.]|nr:VTT domain-containing protein [Thiolinea sp.]